MVPRGKSRYWLHRVDDDILEDISENLVIGSVRKRGKLINEIRSGDRIFLFKPIPLNGRRTLSFVAYTLVERVYSDPESLYDYYESPRKLKLKGIKFFNPPIPLIKFKNKLVSLDSKKWSSALKSEYRQIDEADFRTIRSRAKFIEKFPAYLEEVSFSMDEFILNSIMGLHSMLRKADGRKQMEIKSFIKLLDEFIQSYGINKSYDELEEFYSINAWRTGIKHYPSRDPERIVTLYNSRGAGRDFGLISLE
nr:EVE domain-containing protein [Methanothermobacter sp. K4]